MSDAIQVLKRAVPESQGVRSEGILNFLDAIAQDPVRLHSVMLLRHGKVVAEGWWKPFKPDHKRYLYSLSKSFTSTAVGLAISDGLLGIDDAKQIIAHVLQRFAQRIVRFLRRKDNSRIFDRVWQRLRCLSKTRERSATGRKECKQTHNEHPEGGFRQDSQRSAERQEFLALMCRTNNAKSTNAG